jgi:hypothetical protein
MSPTPASSLRGYARQFVRSGRPHHDPREATSQTTWAAQPVQQQQPLQGSEPTLDEGDDGDDDTQDVDETEEDIEDEDGADIVDVTDDIDDGNGDGEGAIEEGKHACFSRSILQERAHRDVSHCWFSRLRHNAESLLVCSATCIMVSATRSISPSDRRQQSATSLTNSNHPRCRSQRPLPPPRPAP